MQDAIQALQCDDGSGWSPSSLLQCAAESVCNRVWRNTSGCWVIRVCLSEVMAMEGQRLAEV